MSFFAKRKRKSWDTKFVIFPEDTEAGFRNLGSEPKNLSSSFSKAWKTCGKGFQVATPTLKCVSSGKRLRSVRQLARSLLSAKEKNELETPQEPADIVWSSSESDWSDEETKCVPSKPRAGSRPGIHKQTILNSYSRYLNMLDTVTADHGGSDDERHVIDWENASDQEEGESVAEISDAESTCEDSAVQKRQEQEPTLGPDAEISEYSTDGEGVESESLTAVSSLVAKAEQSQSTGRLASDWIKSAQALLQTPQKQTDRKFKTPEDSAKKRTKFLRGGLAERLNRLQCRERSAISFWRHQCISDYKTPAAGKSGVLILKILKIQEECSTQVALCQQIEQSAGTSAKNTPCSTRETQLKVLFTKDTASHLKPGPGDIVHVYPPWQKLVIYGEQCPVILNTHFSQKVLSKDSVENRPNSREKSLTKKATPPSLAQIFNLTETNRNASNVDILAQQGTSNSKVTALNLQRDTRGSEDSVCDSLLEVIESQAAVGWTGVEVKVVVQRVYCLPLGELPSQPLIRNSTIRRAQAFSSEQHNARLCLLVQDVYGIFSEVQLHSFCSSKEKLQQDSEKWEGRSCYLKGMKVLQRTTRGRSAGLFNLIDSLWPPLVPLKVHGKSQESQREDDMVLLAPSFCYILAACTEKGSVQVLQEETVSDLYLPPVVHHLREIFQGVPGRHRCSFSATVVYKRLQNEDPVQSEFWLFVTDAGLQSEIEHGPGIPRVVPVCVTTSCVLHPAIVNALKSDTSCHLTFTFKDAVREHGSILCVERTVLKLEPQPLLTYPVKLDELDPTTNINSLCSVKGTIVGVDEDTAYSWPACDHCGNEKLEAAHEEQQGLFCSLCVRTVSRPTVKMQLEVFLHSVSHPECTVKIKLQQETIASLLTSATSDSEGYEVENVLGQEVSPLSCYVRLIARKPAIWMGLEEISL
ncbi:DNA repair-scaffolding protein isoform X1 [Polyodon spathula]|uniref:DNA repair-scaffolding protein isoform X1 n=1 Tax=Polyodon spathula TaxID=7913 RepID=UPI001B7E1F3E|nr:DNA repair-scaffolding protein isoform X1 [Polyodon spathula]